MSNPTPDDQANNAAAPVMRPANADDDTRQPEARLEEGAALCLSGGGYRAMLFHAGSLLRLNELGVLAQLKRVSSVSGGSITAGVLGLHWEKLAFDAQGVCPNEMFQNLIVGPIRRMASTSIDASSVIGGILLPGTISDRVTDAYDRELFNGATLQDLPSDDHGPRFVINATSVQTGALVRFSKPYLADYKVGRILNPTIPLARAVAASSAFPPVLSPTTIDVDPEDFEADGKDASLRVPPFTDELVLTDGGVYDNLGLETAWKRYRTVLVSDGGGQMEPQGDPDHDWARHSKRILDIVDNQVRSLRKRQLIASYKAPPTDDNFRRGAYWGIRTNIRHYVDESGRPDVLDCRKELTLELAKTPTRLKRLSKLQQDRLMNWGYAVTDAALRRHAPELLQNPAKPDGFPFPGGIG